MKAANADVGNILIEAQTPAKQRDILARVRDCLPLLTLTGALTGGLAYAARVFWPSKDKDDRKGKGPHADAGGSETGTS
jgi:hypothetical protein